MRGSILGYLKSHTKGPKDQMPRVPQQEKARKSSRLGKNGKKRLTLLRGPGGAKT